MIASILLIAALLTTPDILIQQPNGAISNQGEFYPKAGKGVVNPKDGSYLVETPSGYINTKDGSFIPKGKGGEKWERLYK